MHNNEMPTPIGQPPQYDQEKRVDDFGAIGSTPIADDVESNTTMKETEVLDVFGNEDGADIQYKTMTWWQGAMIMIAENISLGILSLPAVLKTIGLVGGIIAILLMGVITTYSGYTLWQFRMRYPQVSSFGDVGQILMGRVGREIFGFAYVTFCVFCMASHVLTFIIAMNTLTNHGTCSIVFGIVGLVLFFLLTIPRTMKNVSFLAIASFISILAAVMITMIALGVNPLEGRTIVNAAHPNFPTAFNSVSNIVFAYGGHAAWLSFISELRDPKDYPKALMTLQAVDTSLYLVAAVVIYYFAGDMVTSPALSSASPLVSKIAWGIALPTIIIAGVIFGHVTAKYIYIRLFAGTKHLHSRGVVATSSWFAIIFGIWFVAWILAESIPNFSNLLGFVAALFASWFSYGLPGVMWLYIMKGSWFSGPKKIFLFCCNVILVLLGIIICVVGLYASGTELAKDTGGKAWSCADNS
ncbi:hypothetical protein E4T47_04628 [Aureobasidium subglaciale]|nr:hypothetical protein E4T47_04628 [Aureobasidium subglaciale]